MQLTIISSQATAAAAESRSLSNSPVVNEQCFAVSTTFYNGNSSSAIVPVQLSSSPALRVVALNEDDVAPLATAQVRQLGNSTETDAASSYLLDVCLDPTANGACTNDNDFIFVFVSLCFVSPN